MTNFTDPATLVGRTVLDRVGHRIGKIGQVYLDDQSGQPVWVAISTGLFGTKDSFAPLGNATGEGDAVRLGVDKDRVKDAPSIENDGHLDEQDQDALYTYYADYFGSAGSADAGNGGVRDDVNTSHEEVRVEREPITDATVGAATDGAEIRR